jgi:carotenoid cleavage dioxygenase-like enzyme
MATAARPKTSARAGFTTLESEVRVDDLPIEGRLPEWLSGSLLRVAPARFETGTRSVEHWFDGQAMLHRFGIADGRVSYANRYLETAANRAMRDEGRIAFKEFATDPCKARFGRVFSLFSPRMTDNANVNIGRVGDALLALTETALAVEFDPDTLETVGVVDATEDVGGLLTTAHPHHDPRTGEQFNATVVFGPRNAYRFARIARGATRRKRIASIRTKRPAYLHSFAMTEHYLVLAEFPLVVNPLSIPLSGRPFIDNYRWRPELGTRFTVVDRETGGVVSKSVGEPCFAFHHVNAFERGDELVVDICAYEDASVIDELRLDRLRAGAGLSIASLTRFSVPVAGGAARAERLADEGLDLPRVRGACNGRPHRFAWGAGQQPDGDRAFIDRLVKIDVESGQALTWDEPGCYPGEPVLVAPPGAVAEDDGVVLSVVMDAASERSFLLVLDAATMQEVARAGVPHAIPFGFHGQFLRTG